MISIGSGGAFAPDASPAEVPSSSKSISLPTGDAGIATALADIKSLVGSPDNLYGLLGPIIAKVEKAANTG
jgi:hypothetical protein